MPPARGRPEALERLQAFGSAHSVPISEFSLLQATHEATVAELAQLKAAYSDQGQELANLKMALKMLCDGSPSTVEQHTPLKLEPAPSIALTDTTMAEQVADRILGRMPASSETSISGFEVIEAEVKSSGSER